MLGSIDMSLKPITPKLQIALPNLNRTVIGNLTEASNITHDVLLSKVSELSFKVPYFIESLSELSPNPNIKKLKERYLIKLTLGKYVEYYMINHIEENGNDSTLEKIVHCYSLQWQLNDKIIQTYNENVNAQDALTQALSSTTWDVGYMDSDYLFKSRNFDVSEVTALNFVFEIAETFSAIVEFDTINRLINLKREANVGQNKGLRLSYGKYLQSIGKESDADEMVTRLHVYGSEELSIQTVNPIGTSYVENFSYFLFPFERDTNNNVIQHSNYMGDDLCHAILDYQLLIDSKSEDFNLSLDNLQTYQSDLLTKQGELQVLENEAKIIQDQIDMAKSMGNDLTILNANLTNKNSEISDKKTEITTVEYNVSVVEAHITELKTTLAIESNFTPEQIIERNYFIIEKVWKDDNIIDAKDLYTEAIQQFESMRKPKITFTIDIVNFLSIVEEQRNWNKLSLGDTVTIKHEQLDVFVSAKITEIHYDYESDSISLTISDTFDVKDAATKVLDKLTEAYSTSTTLEGMKHKWNGASANVGEINEIINNTWDAVSREITAGVNNSISITRKGILITNPQDPNKVLIIQSGVLACSNNGGNTWQNAITPSGIIGEQIFGKIIAGVNLIIENESGKFTLDKDGAVFNLDSFKVISGETDLTKEWVTKSALEINNEAITADFYKSNGINLIKNSVGFAGKDLWVVTGTVNITQEKELIIYGAGSGFQFTEGKLSQEVLVPNNSTFTLSAIVKKGLTGMGYMKIFEEVEDENGMYVNESSFIFESNIEYDYKKESIQFTPIGNNVTVELYGDLDSQLILTSIQLNLGEQARPWQNSTGEVSNTSIKMDINGLRVSQVDEEGNTIGFTEMSPAKFAGHRYLDSNNDGKINGEDQTEEVFSMDKDEFKMKKANVTEEITMAPIKIIRVPLDDLTFRGWAFVSSE